MNEEKQIISIESSDINLEKIVLNTTQNEEFRKKLRSMEAIILPTLSPFVKNNEPVFAATLRDLYYYLNKKGIKTEVATDQEQPPELLLHADLVNLGQIFVNYIVAPIIIGILTNYIYDYIKNKSKDFKKSIVRCELIIEESDGSSKKIVYDGPAESFEHLIERALPNKTGKPKNVHK